MANQIIVTNNGNVQVQISRAALGTISNIPSSNFANFATNVLGNDQPNITNVGTLGNLVVSNTTTTQDLTILGNITVGNLIANTANYSNYAGNLINGSTTVDIPTSNGNVSVTTNGTYTWNFNTSGDTSMPGDMVIDGNITPTSNLTYSLGNNTNRFSNLYLSGNTIILGEQEISANATNLIFTGILTGNASGLTDIQAANITGTGNFSSNYSNFAGNLVVLGNEGNVFVTASNSSISSRVQNGNNYTQQTQSQINWEVYTEDDLTGPNVTYAWINAELNGGNPRVFMEVAPSDTGTPQRVTLDSLGNLNVPGVITSDLDSSITMSVFNDGGNPAINLVNFDSGANTPNTYISVESNNVVISTDVSNAGHTWNFDNTGNLVLPGNTFSVNYANGDQVILGGGNVSNISNGNSNINIPVVDGNVVITSNGTATYTFGIDGTISINETLTLSIPSDVPSGVASTISDTQYWDFNYGTNLPTTGGTGSGLTVDVSDAGSGFGLATINTPGNGYTNGDTITVTNGPNNGAPVASTIVFTITVGGSNWQFDNAGTTIFPTLTVTRGDTNGTLTGQTLLFGDDSQEAIISTPNGDANVNINSQRLVINPGAGAANSTGEGGDIYLYAGRGGDLGGSGGDIKIRGGRGPVNGYGGYIDINGGRAAGDGDGGYISLIAGRADGNGTGGPVDIYGGYSVNNTGGDINISGGASGNSLTEYGNVVINSGASNWQFDNAGNLTVPGYVIFPADSYISQDGGLGIISNGSATITSTADVLINANNRQWTFYGDGNTSIPGYLLLPNNSTIQTTSNSLSLVSINGAVNLNSPGNVPSSIGTKISDTQFWNENAGTDLPTTGGTGSGLTVDITGTLGGGYAVITINTPGSGYTNGDTITVINGPYNGAPIASVVVFTIVTAFDSWVFNTGNLTLPGNTFAVNYANGDPVSLDGTYGNSNVISLLGNFEKNPIGNIGSISFIDSDDLTGISYTPLTPNAGGLTLYYGETVGLGLDATGINLQTIGGLWNFDTTGNLVLPANTFAVNYANGDPVSLDGTYGNSNVISLLGNLENNPISNVSGITFFGDDSKSINYIPVTPGSGSFTLAYGEQSEINMSNLGISLTANANVWNFDTTGNLTLPANGSIINQGNLNIITSDTTGDAGSLTLRSGNSTDVDTVGGPLSIYSGDGYAIGGPITIRSGAGDLENGQGGSLDIQSGGGLIAGQINIQAGTSNGTSGADVRITGGTSNGTNGGRVFITGGQSSLGSSSYGNVILQSGLQNWIFDRSGNLTLPGNTFQVNYANNTPVNIAFKYTREWHVDPVNGSDTNTGAYERPFLTIAQALTSAGNIGCIIYLHAGTYSENVTVSNLNLDIVGLNAVGGIINLTGTWNYSVASGSIRVSGVYHSGAVTISGAGDSYFNECFIVNSLTKSGNGYVSIQASNCQGTGISVTGAGIVAFLNGLQTSLTVNNASATVTLQSTQNLTTAVVTSGSLSIQSGLVFSSGATNNAITSAAGSVVVLGSSRIFNNAGALGRTNLLGFWTINDVQYDRANSTNSGTNLNTVSYFDTIQTTGNITGANLNVGSGNAYIYANGYINTTNEIDYLRTFGSFTSNATQTNSNVGNAVYMTLNNDGGSNGVSIVSSSRITVARTGRYNLQFSAQLEKTDGGTDQVEIWLTKNGSAVANSATQLELKGSGAKDVAAWNWVDNVTTANTYYQIAWGSSDANAQLTAIPSANTLSGVAVPSLIVTVVPVGA